MLLTLLGPDRYAKEQRLHQVTTGAVTYLHGRDGLNPWFTHLGQADLFGQTAAIVAEDVMSGLNAADRKALTEHWQQSGVIASEQVVVVLEEPLELPAKDGLAAVMRLGQVETFDWPSQGQVVRWLDQQAAELGMSIDKRLLVELATMFGPNRLALQTELQKLALMPQPIATLDQIVGMSEDGQAFGLIDCWARRQPEQALAQLSSLWQQQQSALALIGLFERQARLMYMALLAQEAGIGNQELGTTLNVQGFVASKVAKSAGHWQIDQLSRALSRLFELDASIKTGKVESQLGLELWLIESLQH